MFFFFNLSSVPFFLLFFVSFLPGAYSRYIPSRSPSLPSSLRPFAHTTRWCPRCRRRPCPTGGAAVPLPVDHDARGALHHDRLPHDVPLPGESSHASRSAGGGTVRRFFLCFCFCVFVFCFFAFCGVFVCAVNKLQQPWRVRFLN